MHLCRNGFGGLSDPREPLPSTAGSRADGNRIAASANGGLEGVQDRGTSDAKGLRDCAGPAPGGRQDATQKAGNR